MALPKTFIPENGRRRGAAASRGNRGRGIGKEGSAGITLIEIVVVIGLLAIIASLGVIVSMDFYRGYAFASERNIMVSVIEKARNQSLSNINGNEHGVRFDGNDYILFEGPGPGLTYASRQPGLDQVISPQYNVKICITPPPSDTPIDIIFTQLNGDAAPAVSLPITDRECPTPRATISVNSEGRIDW